MKCHNCNETNHAPDAIFCHMCGERLKRKKSGVLWVVLLLLGLAIGVCVALLSRDFEQHSSIELPITSEIPQNEAPMYSDYQFFIAGVNFGFDMTLEELRSENDNASVYKYEEPSNYDDDEDERVVYINGFDYYIINRDLAIIIDEDTNKINFFSTRSKGYITSNGIHVGSTWGEMEQSYPDLSFSIDLYYYNCFTHSFETAITVSNPYTCTCFVFLKNQFSDAQWEAILSSVTYGSDVESSFNVSDIPASEYRSIITSVTVAHIDKMQCDNE